MMFAVFNAAGEADRFGSCPDHAVEQQAREGETVFEWGHDRGSPSNWHIVGGELERK